MGFFRFATAFVRALTGFRAATGFARRACGFTCFLTGFFRRGGRVLAGRATDFLLAALGLRGLAAAFARTAGRATGRILGFFVMDRDFLLTATGLRAFPAAAFRVAAPLTKDLETLRLFVVLVMMLILAGPECF
jgi:hypothetical protein